MPHGSRTRGGIISLGHGIAAGLEQPTRDSGGAGRASSPAWPCSGWGLPCDPCHQGPGALLPHPFTLTCAPEGPSAVYSLWHFPSPCDARALPGTLPCGARTFLRRFSERARRRSQLARSPRTTNPAGRPDHLSSAEIRKVKLGQGRVKGPISRPIRRPHPALTGAFRLLSQYPSIRSANSPGVSW